MHASLERHVEYTVIVRDLTLDLVTGGSHGEFVDTSIGGPSIANVDVAINDLAYVQNRKLLNSVPS